MSRTTQTPRVLPADLKRAWRRAAIYRACIHYGMDEAWALARVEPLMPPPLARDLVKVWFTDMATLQARHRRIVEAQRPEIPEIEFSMAA